MKQKVINAVEALESMIDKHGMSQVLFFLVDVCHIKADHIQTSWQDKSLAAEWLDDGKAIELIAAKIRRT